MRYPLNPSGALETVIVSLDAPFCCHQNHPPAGPSTSTVVTNRVRHPPAAAAAAGAVISFVPIGFFNHGQYKGFHQTLLLSGVLLPALGRLHPGRDAPSAPAGAGSRPARGPQSPSSPGRVPLLRGLSGLGRLGDIAASFRGLGFGRLGLGLGLCPLFPPLAVGRAGLIVLVHRFGRQEPGGGVHDDLPLQGVPVGKGHCALLHRLGGQEVLQIPQILLAVGKVRRAFSPLLLRLGRGLGGGCLSLSLARRRFRPGAGSAGASGGWAVFSAAFSAACFRWAACFSRAAWRASASSGLTTRPLASFTGTSKTSMG